MKNVSVKEAFEIEGLDQSKVDVIGIPDRHKEAVIAIAKLFVAADHADGDGVLDYTNYQQRKYNAIPEMGSPSGAGFRYGDYVYWSAHSSVGARLSFKESDAAKKFFAENIELFKAFMVYERDFKKHNIKTISK